MSGPTWSLWAIPVVVFVSLAVFVASVFYADHAQQRGDRAITPTDRWLAGGVFRGDPRAVNSRDEVPGPDELRSAQRQGPGDELPLVPAQRQAPESADSGTPLPGPPRGHAASRR